MLNARAKKAEYFELLPGKFPALDDLNAIRDRVTRNRLKQRLQRAESGNYGSHRRLAADFIELIADFGPGYRIYLGEDGQVLIIILAVGDKSTQAGDIEEAKAYWGFYKTRKKENRHGGA
jgi:putative addiction module killer protein